MLRDEITRYKLIDKLAEEKRIIEALNAKDLLTDLFEFNKQVLRIEEGSGRVPLAPFHKELCEFVETWEKKRRKLILIPRGHLKSTVVTVGYTLQQIAKNPKIRVLIGNATDPLARSFLSQIKDHLAKNASFINMYGNFATAAPKWSAREIKIITDEESYERKEPTVTAFGMGGSLTSQHYDLIILDDLVNRENIGTKEQIDKVITTYRDILDLLEPTGHLIVIGTRWDDSDLYGTLMEQEKTFFEIMVRSAVEGVSLDDIDEALKSGKVLFPEKYSREYLRQLRAEKGKYSFSCQYLNNAVPAEDATFNYKWFKRYPEEEIKGRPLNIFTFVDPAISQSKAADYTTMVTLGVDQYNHIWILDVYRAKVNSTELINQIFLNYEKYHPRQIAIETVAFQKSLQYFIFEVMRHRNVSLPILEVKPGFHETKEMRILGLVPYYEQGRVHHPEHGYYVDELENELKRFPVGKHDDIIDALSYFPQVIYTPKVKTRERGSGHRNKYLY